MRRRRRFPAGKILALLLVGVLAGTGIFLARHLRPEAVRTQVVRALQKLVATPFKVESVGLELGGVELSGVSVDYPDGSPALRAERISLTLDAAQLLEGKAEVKEVDCYGLVARLRPVEGETGAPGFPGVFRPQPAQAEGGPLPSLRILPGRGGSRVTVQGYREIQGDGETTLAIENLEASARGGHYAGDLKVSLAGLGKIALHADYEVASGGISADATLRELHWTPDLPRRLGIVFPLGLPPVRLDAGEARIVAAGLLVPGEPLGLKANVALSGLTGAFGNLATGETEGFPFRFEGGAGTLAFDRGTARADDLECIYVSSEGGRGRIRVDAQAVLDPAVRALSLKVAARGIHASVEDLRKLVPDETREAIVDKYLPGGTFDIDLHLAEALGFSDRLSGSIRIRNGTFCYAGPRDKATGRRKGFPYPLRDCNGEITIETGVPSPHGDTRVLTLKDISAVPASAPAAAKPSVLAHGSVIAYLDPRFQEPEDADVSITLTDLPIDKHLDAAFEAGPGAVPYGRFGLTGTASLVRLTLRQNGLRGERSPRASYDVTLDGCRMAYAPFPVHVEDISGHLIQRESAQGSDLVVEQLRGRTHDGGAVTAHGHVGHDKNGTEHTQLDIAGSGLKLGPDALGALQRSSAPAGVKKLVGELRPAGNLDAAIRVGNGGDAQVTLDLKGKALLQGFVGTDAPITGLMGRLRFVNGALALHNVQGKLGASPVFVEGSVDAQGVVDVTARVRNLRLGKRARALVAHFSKSAADNFSLLHVDPASKIDLELHAGGGGSSPVSVRATARDLDLKLHPTGIDVALSGGEVSFEKGTFSARRIFITAGGIEAQVTQAGWKPGSGEGGYVVVDAKNLAPTGLVEEVAGSGLAAVLGPNRLLDLKAFRVEFDRSDGKVILSGRIDVHRRTLDAPPGKELEPTGVFDLSPVTVLAPREPGGPLRFAGHLRFQGVNFNTGVDLHDLSGELLLGAASFSGGLSIHGAVRGGSFRLFDRHFEKMATNLDIESDLIRLEGIDAEFYKGNLRGSLQIHLGAPKAFQAKLRLDGADLSRLLDQDARRDDAMSGRVSAALDLASPGGGVQNLYGKGTVSVRDGALMSVPMLRAILGVLSRVTPIRGSSRFRNASAAFEISGETIDVSTVHLSTALNDIYAHGTLSIYGDLDFVVEPQVTRILDLPRLLDLPVLSLFRSLWHKTAYEIRLEGTLQRPSLRLRPLPFLPRAERHLSPQSPHPAHPERMRPHVLP